MLGSLSDLDRGGRVVSLPQKAFLRLIIGTLAGACLGAPLVLLLPGGPHPERSDLWPALIFGALFGGWIGFASSVCIIFVTKFREFTARSFWRAFLSCVLLGALSGGVALFWFGDGFAMALALALQGIVLGALIGTTLSILIALTSRWFR